MADGAKDIYVPLDLHDNEISGVSGINGGTSEDVVMGDGSFQRMPSVPTKVTDLEDADNYVTQDSFSTALSHKQDTIDDIDIIRAGARKGATAYQKPSSGIPERDLSSSVRDKLNRPSTELLSGTTEYWTDRIGYIPPKDTIIIYTDKDTVNGEAVPGIKIGSGNAFVQDLAFVGDELSADLMEHINNGDVHITALERVFWNHKLDIDETEGEVYNETLTFTRE